MKNPVFERLLKIQVKRKRLMTFGLFVLLLILAGIYTNRILNIDNTGFAMGEAVIFFVVIYGLLSRLEKDRKSGRNAKDNLVANELKYRNLIENAGIVMYTTTLHGDITFASSKAVELTEYNLDELVGTNFSEIIDIEWLDIIRDKYVQQFKNNIRETVLEFSIRTKYGDLKWVEQSAVLIIEDGHPIGFQCIIKDITERRQMEDVLRKYEIELVQNQERLQSILDNTTSLIYVKDLEGRYLIANKQFKQVLNIGERKIIGKTDFDFVEIGKAKYYKSTDDQVINSGKPVELEEILEFPDGVHHLLIVKFPLFNARNEIYGISGIATDISDRVRQREELKEAKRIAENAKRLQEQFLANMSHEIRTPMNGIQGMTDLLLETPLNEEQKDFAITIKKSTENLIVIINDILDFSKIKSGKLTIEKIDFDFNEVIENLKAIFRNILIDKGLKLGILIDKDVPNYLNGDPFRLNQILINIIGNAIKFTHKGGISVRISTVGQTGSVITLQIRISDTGIGIPPDKLNEIFDSFTQASVETSRKYGGSGLGLTITKQLIELQKGTISVESEVNVGSTFTINIPFNHSKTNGAAMKGDSVEENFKSMLLGKRILVAEDNDINQKVIRRVLENVGGAVVIVNNGLEAVNMLRNDTRFDLVIMDLQMPEMDGYQATNYIRKVLHLSVPVIAMTASALKGEKAKCLEIGMNEYLSKPFNFPLLYKSIGKILQESTVASNAGRGEKEQKGKENGVNHLFDISELEEMGDDEYLFEIISIFLKSLPEELHKMLIAATSRNTGEVYTIAHKLKSSSGIFKAKGLMAVLINIEEYARQHRSDVLVPLCIRAKEEFKKLEGPLEERLGNIKENTGAAAMLKTKI